MHGAAVSRYVIECRHASGSSCWTIEPDTDRYETHAEAKAVADSLETHDDEGAELEYRMVEEP